MLATLKAGFVFNMMMKQKGIMIGVCVFGQHRFRLIYRSWGGNNVDPALLDNDPITL